MKFGRLPLSDTAKKNIDTLMNADFLDAQFYWTKPEEDIIILLKLSQVIF